MTFSQAPYSRAAALSIEALIETLDRPSGSSLVANDIVANDIVANDDRPGHGLSYRSSPDGSLTMGTDSLSGQVVLIVQNNADRWEIALPPKVARFAAAEYKSSLAAAKQTAEAAFRAYLASQ